MLREYELNFLMNSPIGSAMGTAGSKVHPAAFDVDCELRGVRDIGFSPTAVRVSSRICQRKDVEVRAT